jgi:DNA-binding NarL/FixJ family response regulator
MITILLVDDYPVMRQLLRDILERYPDIQIVGEAANGEEAVARCSELRPRVVVIDLRLPTISGMETATLIKLQHPSTTIIGLTAAAEHTAETAMRDAGAVAVLNKGDVLNALYPTIVEGLGLKSMSTSVSPCN